MDSSVVAKNYASDDKTKYGTHTIELLSNEVTFYNNIGKFSLSYITTNLDSSSVYERTTPKTSSANMVNKDKLNTSNITTSNYIEIEVPKHLFYITEIKITPNTKKSEEGCLGSCAPVAVINRITYKKGQKFIITNVGGSVDTPCIIGVV